MLEWTAPHCEIFLDLLFKYVLSNWKWSSAAIITFYRAKTVSCKKYFIHTQALKLIDFLQANFLTVISRFDTAFAFRQVLVETLTMRSIFKYCTFWKLKKVNFRNSLADFGWRLYTAKLIVIDSMLLNLTLVLLDLLLLFLF